MKKFFVSMGVVAAGAASLHAAYAPDASDSKMWNLGATLRGFYDDNYTTTQQKHQSAGFEVNPTFTFNMPLQQTEIGLRYSYGLYYYQERERLGQNPIDQTHEFDLWLDHAFTPRWEGRVEDSVTVAQEPQLLAAGAVSVAQRVEGNNIVNNGSIKLHTDWTRQFSTQLNFQNTFASFENSGGTASNPSLAGLLDRDENLISLDFQWHVTPETMTFIGYQYGQVIFLSNEQIAQNPITSAFYYSNSRDNRSHYGYVGLQHAFLENLTGSVRAGVQYTEYYNDPSSTSALGPYGDASLVYTYASGSYMQLGVMETRNATDTVKVDNSGHITQDEESTVIYGSINHPLTPKLTASAVAHYQYSIYHDGAFNNQTSDYYDAGLNLTYAFNRHFSSDLGYNFDWYTSAAEPGYTRNQVYLGVTASY